MNGTLIASRPESFLSTPLLVGPIIAVLDGGQADQKVLELADLLRDCTNAPGLALWVVDVPRNLALGQCQDAPIDWDMVEHSRRLVGSRGLRFQMTWGRSRSTTILEEAQRTHATGIVLGVRWNRHTSKFPADWQVSLMKKAACTVWLVQDGSLESADQSLT